MDPITTAVLRRAMAAAGWQIEDRKTCDPLQRVAWQIRARCHRELCGHQLTDHRALFQIGLDESSAHLFRFADLPQILEQTAEAFDRRAALEQPVAGLWFLAPGSLWLATCADCRVALPALLVELGLRPAPPEVLPPGCTQTTLFPETSP